MKMNGLKWVVLLLAVSLVSVFVVSAASPVTDAANAYFAQMPADVYKIDEKAFVAKVKSGESMLILDIRQNADYLKGHVQGAVNIPWGIPIGENIDKLPGDKVVMVYCYTGQTAGQAVALLNIAGINAKSVNLGWNFGISKVAGVADVMETKSNELPKLNAVKVNKEVQAAITEYFKGMDAIKTTMYANYKISEADAKAVLDKKDKNVIFLSVRKAEDYEKGHIEGAINIPFAKGMEQQFGKLPKDKKIIVYCYTGQTAGQTVAVLRMLGYDAVSLNGGMGMPSNAPQGWANQGLPVVK